MKKNILSFLIAILLMHFANTISAQIGSKGYKSTFDFTMDKSGTVVCEVTNKYNAAVWDSWTKMVGTNTSIINNLLRKLFPKYHLSDFKHSNDPNERTNTVKFKIDGMMNINKNGKWETELGQKDPNITKVSSTDWLLVDEGGETLKIHLPAGTKNSKVEKNSFGKAVLTYSASAGGPMNAVLRYGGILIALAGVALFIRNRVKPKINLVVNTQAPATVQKETTPVTNIPNEISSN